MKVVRIIGVLVLVAAGIVGCVAFVLLRAEQRNASVERLLEEERYLEALPLAEKLVRANRILVRTSPGGGFGDELARSLNYLGFIHKNLGHYTEAEALYAEARDLAEVAPGRMSAAYADYTNNLAMLYHDMADNERALPLAEDVVEIRRAVLGEQTPGHATALNNLARINHHLGNLDAAVAQFESAIAILDGLDARGNPNYTVILNNFADVYNSLGDMDNAVRLQREVLRNREEHHGARSAEYALGLNNLGFMVQQSGDDEESERLFLQARELYESLGLKSGQDYAAVLSNLANAKSVRGDYAGSEAGYRETLAVLEAAIGRQHPSYIDELDSLASVCDLQDKLVEAEALYREAAELTAAGQGTASDAHLERLFGIAWYFEGNEMEAEAEAEFLAALDLAKRERGEGSEAHANALDTLCWFYRYSEDPGRADAHYEVLGPVTAAAYGRLSPEYQQYVFDRAEYFEEVAAPERAEAAVQQLAADLKAGGSDYRIEYLETLAFLGYFHTNSEAYEKAISCFAEVLAGHEAESGKESEAYSAALWDLASVFWAQKDYGAADPLMLEMVTIDRKLHADDADTLCQSITQLARFRAERERNAEAEALYREALGLLDRAEPAIYTFFAQVDCAEALAPLLAARGAHDEADSLLAGLLGVQRKTYADYPIPGSRLLSARARLLQGQKRFEEAETVYREAKSLMEDEFGRDSELYAEVCRQFAGLYTEMGNTALAEQLLAEIPVGGDVTTEEEANVAE